MGMVGEGAAAETEVVVRPRDTASPRPRQVRGIREDGETHIRGAENARAMPVDRDEAKKMFEPFKGAELSNGLLASESTGGRQDAGINAPAIVH